MTTTTITTIPRTSIRLVLPNGVRIALEPTEQGFAIPAYEEHPATVYQPSGVRIADVVPETASVITDEMLRALVERYGCRVALGARATTTDAVRVAQALYGHEASFSAHRGATARDRAVRISGCSLDDAKRIGHLLTEQIGGTLGSDAGAFVAVWL